METPIQPSGERFGDEEIALLTEVIRSQKLNCNCGTRVREFAQAFADYMGMKHGVMVTSGTAAIHLAIGAINLNPGDEVITAPITDMGTIFPILAQNAVPVFADLDPDTLCLKPLSRGPLKVKNKPSWTLRNRGSMQGVTMHACPRQANGINFVRLPAARIWRRCWRRSLRRPGNVFALQIKAFPRWCSRECLCGVTVSVTPRA